MQSIFFKNTTIYAFSIENETLFIVRWKKKYIIVITNCGKCHMTSLFTSLAKTTIATIFSEAVLQTCQHQLPQALTATSAHHNIITSLQVGPLSYNFLRFSTITGPLLATSAPLPSHHKLWHIFIPAIDF